MSVGNLSAKLSLDTGSFSSGTKTAETEAQRLSDGLQKQINEYKVIGRSADAYRLSLMGVSRASIERIESQQRELAELQASHVAERVAAEAKAAITARAAQLTQQATTAEERRLSALTELTSLLKQGAIAQQTYNFHVGKVNSVFSAATAGAGKAGSAMGMMGKNASFAFQQLAFGVQDAATMYGLQGVSGAIRASSNNLIQFASLIGPYAGTAAAVIGTGVSLWFDYADRQKKAADELKKHKEVLDEFLVAFKEIDRLQGDTKSKTTGKRRAEDMQDATRDELADERNRITNEQDDLLIQQAALRAKYQTVATKYVGPTMAEGLPAAGIGETPLADLMSSLDKPKKISKEDKKKIDDLERKMQDNARQRLNLQGEANMLPTDDEALERDRQKERDQQIKDSESDYERQQAAKKTFEDQLARGQAKQREIELRAIGQVDPGVAKAMSIQEKAKKDLEELTQLQQLPGNIENYDKLEALKESVVTGADIELAKLGQDKQSKTGKAEELSADAFGSSEAFKRVVNASMGLNTNSMADNTRKISEAAQEQIKLARDSLAELKKKAPVAAASL